MAAATAAVIDLKRLLQKLFELKECAFAQLFCQNEQFQTKINDNNCHCHCHWAFVSFIRCRNENMRRWQQRIYEPTNLFLQCSGCLPLSSSSHNLSQHKTMPNRMDVYSSWKYRLKIALCRKSTQRNKMSILLLLADGQTLRFGNKIQLTENVYIVLNGAS